MSAAEDLRPGDRYEVSYAHQCTHSARRGVATWDGSWWTVQCGCGEWLYLRPERVWNLRPDRVTL